MDISKIDFKATIERLNSLKLRSVWNNAVRDYSLELLDNVCDALEYYRSENKDTTTDLIGACFNTCIAQNESDFDVALRCSEGGCFLIYDSDIASKLCTKSELKKVTRKDGSLKNPNSRENWIQCQGRALFQAYRMLKENLVLTE